MGRMGNKFLTPVVFPRGAEFFAFRLGVSKWVWELEWKEMVESKI